MQLQVWSEVATFPLRAPSRSPRKPPARSPYGSPPITSSFCFISHFCILHSRSNSPGLQTSSCQCALLARLTRLVHRISNDFWANFEQTFEEGHLHWCLGGEVKLGLGRSIHVAFLLGKGAHLFYRFLRTCDKQSLKGSNCT